MAARPARPATLCVHAGDVPSPSGAVNTPIEQSSTFLFPELPDGAPSAHIYTRYDNPTVAAVETKLAALESGGGPTDGAALLFSSGMAATHVACDLRPGQRIAAMRGLYGGTTAYFRDELQPSGVTVAPFDACAAELKVPAADLAWIESITNPLLRVPDVAAVAKAAHDAGARLAVDATFATPILQRPLSLGADIVMHSASKSLGGHSDLIAGALVVPAVDRHRYWTRRRNLGGVMDPHAAFLLGRGMKTLALRVRQQCANAQALAEAAADAGMQAHYPGLPDHPDHATARRVLEGFGGVVTLDAGSLAAAKAFRRALQVMLPAASLGGVDSLVSLPLETSHAYATADERRADGVTDGLVRVSVGIEDIEDLKEDLARGLAAARNAK